MNTLGIKNNASHVYAHRWWSFTVLSFSLLVIGLDNTVLNVALPTLARDLEASTSQLQWIVDAYTLAFAGLLLTSGSLSDRFGRKRALLLGLLIFGSGSVWAAFSGSANVLIAARALMGIGGALIMPSTMSITTNTFPAKERAKAIGALTGVGGIGIILGPLLGGALLAHFSWGAVFLINVPVILVTIVGSFFLVPESKDPQASPLDPIGALLSISGLVTLVYGIIEVPVYGWGASRIIASFAAAAILLTVFGVWELRARSPMLNMQLFANPRFSAASLAGTFASFSMYGALFFLTQYLQLVLGYTALEAGIRFIPLALALIIGASLGGRLAELAGTKIVVTGGLVILASGLALMSTASTSSGYGLVAAVLSILGLGIGITAVPATNSILGALPLGKAGVGSAVNDTTQEVGGALGVAVLGSILSSVYRFAIDHTASLQVLPPQVKTALRDSIGEATVISSQLGGHVGHIISSAANAAFITAMSQTVLIGAGVMMCSALITLLFLPARAKDEQANRVNRVSLTEQHMVATIEQQKEEEPFIS